jgi:hypothetical protein
MPSPVDQNDESQTHDADVDGHAQAWAVVPCVVSVNEIIR